MPKLQISDEEKKIILELRKRKAILREGFDIAMQTVDSFYSNCETDNWKHCIQTLNQHLIQKRKDLL